MRIVIVFENRIRPETTGTYCLRALQRLTNEGAIQSVSHLLPDQLDAIRQGEFELFLFIDDGLDYEIPAHCRPAVWWAIDTHLNFERCLSRARSVDWTFAAQRDGTTQLQQQGIRSATWLPLACDPEIHARQQLPKQYDIGFVGHFFSGERQDLLELIAEQFPDHFIGQCDYREMSGIYSQSRIVFNRSLQNDINMRVFEALCSGSLLLTNNLTDNGLEDLFTAGTHLTTYENSDDLLEKMTFFLKHEELGEQIAEAGRQEVLAKHTYQHRMQQLLESVSQHALESRRTAPVQSRASSSRSAPVLKNLDYFSHERPDVLEMIPPSAQRVLDLGCGTGRLGASLKSRQQAHVTGIELNPQMAHQARERLDEVHCGNIESGNMDFPEGTFDCIICADVLEHLRSPERVLHQLRRWLRPDGCLIASLPNVRHHSVVLSLLAGNWSYESAGLLDEDHVRFFTRREMEKLLDRSGFIPEELRMVPGEGFQQWDEQGRPLEVQLQGLQVKASSIEDAAEFFAYQYLTRSRPVPATSHGITSIILVTHNQLAYTKACLDSIRLRTDEPYELIVVDNASTDGTVEFLQACDDVKLINNDSNRGFPAAVNQGIHVATGHQILLLNNDTIVTSGWLKRMLNVLQAEDSIGLVGPVTNRISGEQQVPVTYFQLNDLDGFAWDWGKQHGHELQQTDRLVGFCLLIKRSVIDAIGLLDERFGIGNFEDDDYCRRALEAGFHAVIARGAFVHHFGSVTFQGSGIDFSGLLQQNQQRYADKWNDQTQSSPAAASKAEPPAPPLGQPRPQFLAAADEEGALHLQLNTVGLSACLIVRDNEQTIRPCLESIRPWVDEIVVVDTGSTDQTPEICKELGARVFYWAWQDDFSAARNVSFNHARGEWLFWMDSDDTIPEECGCKLRELALGEHSPETLGYVMQVHCPGQTAQEVTVVDHIKLIANRPELRFEFRIHEQILPAIRRAGGEVSWTDLYVIHSGSDHSEAVHQRKLERDFRLLNLEYQDRPDHPFVLFNLGMTHADAGQHEEAVKFLKRCLQVSGPEESHVRKAYALLIGALVQLRREAEADQLCGEALKQFPDDKELLFRQAMLYHASGRLQRAEQTYLRILAEQTGRHFTSVDVGISDYKAKHNLAIVYEDMRDHQQAIHIWNEILKSQPAYEPARSAVAQIRQKMNVEAL